MFDHFLGKSDHGFLERVRPKGHQNEPSHGSKSTLSRILDLNFELCGPGIYAPLGAGRFEIFFIGPGTERSEIYKTGKI